MRFRTTSVALALWALSAPPAVSQQTPAEQPVPPVHAEVLVLGVYHMANPGRHIFNTQADDVLALKRQAEIAALSAALAGQLIDSPNERVLVIFGVGHLGWLQHDFGSNPNVRLRKLTHFAK